MQAPTLTNRERKKIRRAAQRLRDRFEEMRQAYEELRELHDVAAATQMVELVDPFMETLQANEDQRRGRIHRGKQRHNRGAAYATCWS